MPTLPTTSTSTSTSADLPMLGAMPRERCDAARNRRLILNAARRLLAERGAERMTMDAVAAAAGVGKGTVFRRFGDRAGLTEALLDEYMREFQDSFLSGPPPLGPGAPAPARLAAFFDELIRIQVTNIQPALAAENLPGPPTAAFGSLLVHVRALLNEIDVELAADVLAGMLLSAVAPSTLYHLHSAMNADIDALQAAIRILLQSATGSCPRPPNARGSGDTL